MYIYVHKFVGKREGIYGTRSLNLVWSPRPISHIPCPSHTQIYIYATVTHMYIYTYIHMQNTV